MKVFHRVVSWILHCLLCSIETSFPVVMPAASPLMEPAPSATRKSSLEIMLDTIRERDERQQDDGEPFLPPSPARPRGRGRPPTSVRRPLPSGFKAGNGKRTVSSTEPVDKNGAVHPATGAVVDDAMSPDSEEQCARGNRMSADPTLSPHSTGKLIKEDKDNTVMWTHHGAIDIVDSAQQQDLESEINVENELPDISPSASPSSITRVERRTPGQSSRSASLLRSSSGSSRESEPGKRTKAGVGKLLTDSAGCVRAPVEAVARMVLSSCGNNSSGVRALEEQTGHQGAEASLHDVDGDNALTTDKALAASSMPRSGVVWRWLKKISCWLGDVREAEEATKTGQRIDAAAAD